MATITISASLTDALDAYATAQGITRDAAAAHLLGHALAAAAPASQTVADRIRDAYLQVTPGMRRWVSLTNLRPLLRDIDRPLLDAELLRLHRSQAITIIPEENRRSITPADRAAAILVGGEERHLIAIDD